MTTWDFEDKKRTPLDDQLDAALAKYAAAEPRAGLEARILANLRAQQSVPSRMLSWRWAVTLTTALLIMTVLIWRAERHRLPNVVRQANPEHQTQPPVAKNTQAENDSSRTVSISSVRRKRHTQRTRAEAPPKLDQFPSPRPLTEQEKLLAEYVNQFQEEAVVVARARAEVLRQDLEQMQRGSEVNDDRVEHTK